MQSTRRSDSGFTLIELMIVIAIIGILSSIALPSYRDYVRKANMSEVVALVDTMKKKSIEHYNTTGTWPADGAAGLALMGATSQTDFATDIIDRAHFGNRRGIGQVYVFVGSGLTGTGNWVRYNMEETNGMIRGSYCHAGDETFAEFVPYLPEAC